MAVHFASSLSQPEKIDKFKMLNDHLILSLAALLTTLELVNKAVISPRRFLMEVIRAYSVLFLSIWARTASISDIFRVTAVPIEFNVNNHFL